MVGTLKKPKIAILTIRNTYEHGGVQSLTQTAYEFCSRYFEPTIFVLSFDPKLSTSLKRFDFKSSTKSSTINGFPYIEIGARWSFWEPLHYSAPLKEWKKALKTYRYFFVASATPIAGHPLALLNKRYPLWICTPYQADREQRKNKLQGLRYIIDRLAQPFMLKIERKILEQAAHIWAMSTYSKKQFQNISHNIDEHLSICPQYVKTEEISTTSKDKNLIIAIGRFSDPRKNITMLIKAFQLIKQDLPKARLVVIGQKPIQQQYKSITKQCNITFTGPIARKDYEQYLALASLKLVTSFQEGFGIACLEALSYGIPVITTKCGGIEDFVLENITGFLVPINDHEAMHKKAIKVLSNSKLWNKLSLNAKKLTAQNFSQQKVYSLFKNGLCITYPELEQHFAAIDVHNQDQSIFSSPQYEHPSN